ncbi:MAG: YfcE family phosphodiesterase [Treponema sp.]|nr:YfcE family phosphodiesterase [Treponema sp.]
MDNKKILVISDTHGDRIALGIVLNWAKERLPPKDSIFAAAFLGDGISDLQPAAKAAGFYCDWKIVSGNNDYGIHAAETAVFDFENHRFFICHGHRYNLFGDYNSLASAAGSRGATVALYGHSHVPHYKKVNGIHLINPGSLSRSRSRIGDTFAVIECAVDKELNVEFFGINEHAEIHPVKIK